MVITSVRVQSLEAVFLIFPACLEHHVGVLPVVGGRILDITPFPFLMYLCVTVCLVSG